MSEQNNHNILDVEMQPSKTCSEGTAVLNDEGGESNKCTDNNDTKVTDLPSDVLCQILSLVHPRAKLLNYRALRETLDIINIRTSSTTFQNIIDTYYEDEFTNINLLPPRLDLDRLNREMDRQVNLTDYPLLGRLSEFCQRSLLSFYAPGFSSPSSYEVVLNNLSSCTQLKELSFTSNVHFSQTATNTLETFKSLERLQVFRPSLSILSLVQKSSVFPMLQSLSLQQMNAASLSVLPQSLRERYNVLDDEQMDCPRFLTSLQLSFTDLPRTNTPVDEFELVKLFDAPPSSSSCKQHQANSVTYTKFLKNLEYISLVFNPINNGNFDLLRSLLQRDNNGTSYMTTLNENVCIDTLVKSWKWEARTLLRYGRIETYSGFKFRVEDFDDKRYLIFGSNDVDLNDVETLASSSNCNTVVISGYVHLIGNGILDEMLLKHLIEQNGRNIYKLVWIPFHANRYRDHMVTIVGKIVTTIDSITHLEMGVHCLTRVSEVIEYCGNIQYLSIYVQAFASCRGLVHLLHAIHIHCKSLKYLHIVQSSTRSAPTESSNQHKKLCGAIEMFEDAHPTLNIDCVRHIANDRKHFILADHEPRKGANEIWFPQYKNASRHHDLSSPFISPTSV